MNQRINLQQVIPLLVALLLVGALAILAPRLGDLSTIRLLPVSSPGRATITEAETLASARAADLSAYRWQEMAKFYEEHGMLTRDTSDYEAAADLSTYRWQEMAKFYEEHGMLTRDNTPISVVVMSYADHLNAGDLDGTMANFADDTRMYLLGLAPGGFELLNGKEQVRAMFEENIASHFKMDVEVLSVKDDVVTARLTTWHDFTRQIGAAPLEATSVYVIKDGKIVSETWHVSEESVAKFRSALAKAMPAEVETQPAAITPVSAMTVTFANGTCSYSGPLTLRAGKIAVAVNVQDQDKDKFAFSAFTLDPDRDLADLMASTIRPAPPAWSDPLYVREILPGESSQFDLTIQEGPVYVVCWSSPPDLATGAIGPFTVVK